MATATFEAGRPFRILKTLVFFLFALLLAIALSGCEGDVVESASSVEESGEAPAVRSLGVVLDGTGSTADSFSVEMRDELALAVQRLFDPVDEDALKNGATARDGLDVYVYCVGEDTSQYGNGQNLILSIPGYPSLEPRPSDASSSGYADELLSWNAKKDAWLVEYQASQTTAQEALAQLAAIEATTQDYSGIYTTVSALSRVLPQGSSVIVFSDLENTADVTVDGSLTGSSIHVVQPYISNDMAYEDGLKTSFLEYLSSVGVVESDVAFYAPEQANAAIAAALA